MIEEIKRGHSIFIDGLCPICGHQGWCCTSMGNDGNLYVTCKRDASKSDISGYTYIGPSEKGNSKYIFGDRSLTQNKNWQPSIPKRKKVENSIKPLRDDELDKVYRKILSMLSLEDHHRKQLKEEGWTDELIKKYNFKSYPVEDYTRFKKNIKTPNPTRYEIGQKLHKEFGDLTGVPGLYIRENKKGNRFWTLAGKPGILFEITNVYGHVIGLRVRLDDPGDGGKYRWVSSYFLKEFDGIWKNLYECGCKANNRVSISFPKIRGDMYCCHLTEGEKKHKAVNEFLKSPCISVAGVDSWADILDVNPMTNERPVDVLKKMGVKMFIIAYDNDKYKNEAVMNSQIQVIEALRKENFMIGLAEWDSYMGIKIDDILFNGYKPMYFLV